MRKFPLYICLLLAFNGCSQKAKYTINQNQHITADNIVEEISKHVKQYAKEPLYVLSYGNYYCYFAVKVNDCLVYKDFEEPIAGSGFDINQAIFKSGVQKVTYYMYPIEKLNDDVYNTLIDESFLKFKLGSYDPRNSSAGDIFYSEYKTPSTRVAKSEHPYDTIDKFEGAGKTYYEGSFTINVDVPYELHPAFENAQDLRKMDAKTLEAKLLEKYKQVRDIYQSKDLDNIARISYDNLKDQFVAKYDTKKYISDVWKMLTTAYKSSTFEMQPIENYKMQFFADGRLVALMIDTKDNRLRGNTALWAKVNHDGGLRPLFCNRYFYIPQGETEFKVY